MHTIMTSRGDGRRMEISRDELRTDIIEGSEQAARKGKIDALTSEDIDHMVDIFCQPGKTVSVEPGREVVVTDDGAGLMASWGRPSAGHAIPISDHQSILMYERVYCGDTCGLGFPDYSYKPVKSAIGYARSHYRNISMLTTIPLIYGSQPNMGMYYHPTGPVESPSDYFTRFEFDKARAAQEEAAGLMRRDIMDVAESLYEVGCEGMNLDTSGSAGDADFWGCLKVVEDIKAKMPDMPVEMGMAGEMVMGLHGELSYGGERLAGMFPHQQAKAAAAAGVDVFGVAVNSDTSRSTPYNLARTVTFTRAASQESPIPVHANSGMGVGGMPMTLLPPVGCSTRCAKALVEIGKADGLQVGTGDSHGVAIAQIVSSCMGGIRTAGDLVAWMQLTRRMKIDQAKAYVAQKLDVSTGDLTDETVMAGKRTELGIGSVIPDHVEYTGMAAKTRISKLLDIPIRSVELYKKHMAG